jgi:branched-chain amino acid transport system permease protein
MQYLLHISIVISIYAILAISLDLVAGRTGLLSISHAAFYGLGAYTSALLAMQSVSSFSVGLVAAAMVGIAASFLVSLPSLRLREDHFAIATFGFQMILFGILNNWTQVTRGPLGIPGIPRPIILGWHIDELWEFSLIALLFASFAHLVVWRIVKSPFGRVLHAIREDEVLATSSGKNTFRFKIATFAVSAALASVAGSLYAHYMTFIDPTSFTVMESIFIISIVIIGGAGSFWGPVVGAVVLVTLPEILRFVGMPSSIAANVRQILYGGLLVLFMMLRPHGLMGKYAFGKGGTGK